MITTNPKIVVIGAGLAGLTTAYRLHQHGADVHLYEAHTRVGGRIFTVHASGNIVELGGQNIADGGDAENIHRLINEFKLETFENKVLLAQSYFDGEKIYSRDEIYQGREFDPETLRAKLIELAAQSTNMKEVLDALLDKNDPLYKSSASRLSAFEGGPLEKLSTLYIETLLYTLLGGLAPVHDTHGIEGYYINLLSIKEGSSMLTEKLAAALEGRLHLDKPLTSVTKNRSGYTLQFKEGETLQADILVLAIPCTVYSDINFTNDVIPSDTLTAIKNVQYGTNSRIVLPFSSPPPTMQSLISDQAIGFYNPERHNYTIYFTGEAGIFTQETLSTTFLSQLPLLKFAYPSLYPTNPPTYVSDTVFASYSGSVAYSWPSDPYIKGSYSYIEQGQETTLTSLSTYQGETVRTLFTPLHQSLYFAGEHTSILLDVPGTMEAACESGERTSRMILNKHR